MLNFILGTILFVADIWAISQIFMTKETNGTKALWIIVVLALPLIGLLIWYFYGPKPNK